MAAMAKVDVAIVAFDDATELPACLKAVRGQGDAIGDVLVVDNASRDGSADAAALFGGVEVVRNQTNIGYAAAMNQAFARTGAPFLLSLNADCVLAPGYVDACLDALATAPRAAAATGVLRLPDGRIDSTGIDVTTAAVARDRDRHAAAPDLSHDPFGVSGAAAMWRRAALEDLGPAPWWEFLFVYWDDVELCWRLRDRGWTFVCASSAQATHARGSDTARAEFIEAQSFRNRLATVARHEGFAGLSRPSNLLVTSVVGGRLALRHPRALRSAHALAAIRAGSAARRADPVARVGNAPLSPHPWRAWWRTQLRGASR